MSDRSTHQRAGRMPAAFIGHGSPMNTLERNRFTDAWREYGEQVRDAHGAPSAILVVSAHWYINATAVTAMAEPRVIHDFYGFPPELFAFDYPAPGSPTLAARVVEVAAPTWVGLDTDSWGLDHGTWSVLAHLFPDADVPVVQLALDATKPWAYHLELGRALAPLLDEGVMVVGSGNIVHHLGMVDWSRPDDGADWAERFDATATTIMLTAPGALLELATHPDAARAVPTPDHFLPALYIAGIADAIGGDVDTIVEGCTLGSLSMTSYAVT